MNLAELTNDQMVNTTVKDRLKQKKASQPAPVKNTAPASPTAPAGAIVNMPSGDHFVKTTDGTWAQSDDKGNLTGRPAEGPNSAMARDLEKYAAQTGVASSVDAPADPVVQKTTPDAPAPAPADAPAPVSQDIPKGTKAIFVKADKYINDPKMRKDVTVLGPSQDGNANRVSVKDEKNKTFNVGKDRLLDPKTKTPILKPQAAPTPTASAPVQPTASAPVQPTASAPVQPTASAPVQPTAGAGANTSVNAPNTAKPVGGMAQNPQSTAGMSRSNPPSAEIDPKAGTINAPEPEGAWDKVKRVGQGVVDKITTGTGGSLATKTMQDPNASTSKKIGAKFGAGVGRAMSGGIKGLRNLKGQGQQTPAAQTPTMSGQDHRQLGTMQANALKGDLPAAKGLAQKLSDLTTKGVDAGEISNYANTIAPVLKRGGLAKTDPQLYTHVVKLARSMRKEAYEHMCKILEHAGFTWLELGYTVMLSESTTDVILLPTVELNEAIELDRITRLAGI